MKKFLTIMSIILLTATLTINSKNCFADKNSNKNLSESSSKTLGKNPSKNDMPTTQYTFTNKKESNSPKTNAIAKRTKSRVYGANNTIANNIEKSPVITEKPHTSGNPVYPKNPKAKLNH